MNRSSGSGCSRRRARRRRSSRSSTVRSREFSRKPMSARAGCRSALSRGRRRRRSSTRSSRLTSRHSRSWREPATSRRSDMKIKTNGIETNYVIEGEGPWLTMSHSLACNLSMWDPQAKLLAKHFKVLRYDTRGHGGSSAPDGRYTLDQLADDAKALFDALGTERTHWVGLSMGGMIGQAFALKHPGFFESMVLADTSSRRPPNAQQMWGDRRRLAQEKGMEALVQSTLERWFTEPYRQSHKDVMARIAGDIRATPV